MEGGLWEQQERQNNKNSSSTSSSLDNVQGYKRRVVERRFIKILVERNMPEVSTLDEELCSTYPGPTSGRVVGIHPVLGIFTRARHEKS